MAASRHVLQPVLLLICLLLVCVPASAQQAPVPDTAAGRRMLDSLVRVGAVRLPARDTVRLPADTVRGVGLLQSSLQVTGFSAAILVLVTLGATTIVFSRQLLQSFKRNSTVAVRSHWGGFGGGDSGWEISQSLSLLTVTVLLAVLTVVVAGALLGAVRPQKDAPNPAPRVTTTSTN